MGGTEALRSQLLHLHRLIVHFEKAAHAIFILVTQPLEIYIIISLRGIYLAGLLPFRILCLGKISSLHPFLIIVLKGLCTLRLKKTIGHRICINTVPLNVKAYHTVVHVLDAGGQKPLHQTLGNINYIKIINRYRHDAISKHGKIYLQPHYKVKHVCSNDEHQAKKGKPEFLPVHPRRFYYLYHQRKHDHHYHPIDDEPVEIIQPAPPGNAIEGSTCILHQSAAEDKYPVGKDIHQHQHAVHRYNGIKSRLLYPLHLIDTGVFQGIKQHTDQQHVRHHIICRIHQLRRKLLRRKQRPCIRGHGKGSRNHDVSYGFCQRSFIPSADDTAANEDRNRKNH